MRKKNYFSVALMSFAMATVVAINSCAKDDKDNTENYVLTAQVENGNDYNA
jgi:hypothetical protein